MQRHLVAAPHHHHHDLPRTQQASSACSTGDPNCPALPSWLSAYRNPASQSQSWEFPSSIRLGKLFWMRLRQKELLGSWQLRTVGLANVAGIGLCSRSETAQTALPQTGPVTVALTYPRSETDIHHWKQPRPCHRTPPWTNHFPDSHALHLRLRCCARMRCPGIN